jgi:hypothetical protein
MGRKRKNKRYFTNITEIAISAYNKCDDYELRNKIFKRFIHYPFDKLAENVIHTYKTYYFDDCYEDVKSEVVTFLIEKIHKFNGENGRAFSYFTVVARNYLFNENNANYAAMKAREDLSAVDPARSVVNEVVRDNYREGLSDFMDYYTKYIDTNLDIIFEKKRDADIADSVNELFKNRKDLFSYNKKALYILIRERTNVNTQYITKVINTLKGIYLDLYKVYIELGYIPEDYKLENKHG